MISYPTLKGDFFNFARNLNPRINILIHNSISYMLIKVKQVSTRLMKMSSFHFISKRSEVNSSLMCVYILQKHFPSHDSPRPLATGGIISSDLLSCWIKDVTHPCFRFCSFSAAHPHVNTAVQHKPMGVADPELQVTVVAVALSLQVQVNVTNNKLK